MDIPLGTNAEDFNPNSLPLIGGLVLFNYNGIYHVAKIVSFTKEGFLVVEGNKVKCKKTWREVSAADPFIRGYWYPTPSV